MLDAALCIAHLVLCAVLPQVSCLAHQQRHTCSSASLIFLVVSFFRYCDGQVFFAHFMWVTILKLLLFGVLEMRTIITIYQARWQLLPHVSDCENPIFLTSQKELLISTPPHQPLRIVFTNCTMSLVCIRYAQDTTGLDGLRQRLAKVHLRFYAALFASIIMAIYCRSV